MTDNSANEIVKSFIEDSNYAYNIYNQSGYMNGDFAEFAALSYKDFQIMLQRPDMTQQELRRLLRRAGNTHRSSAPNSCWSSFLASYLQNPANASEIA